MGKVDMEFSGERYIPSLGGTIELEHWHRYLLAREAVKGCDVLDVASGEGYGSLLLASVAKTVLGVDLDGQAVFHASSKYAQDNLRFVQGDCTSIPLSDASVDVVVSFETLEHHDQHEKMLEEIKRVLRPDGVLIISTPDRYEYSERVNFNNEFHVKELYRHEFELLLGEYFKNCTIMGQRIQYGSGIFGEAAAQMLSYEAGDKQGVSVVGLLRPVYLIAVASDATLPKLPNSIMEQPMAESEEVASLTALVEAERKTATDEFARLNAEVVRLNVEVTRLRDEGVRFGECECALTWLGRIKRLIRNLLARLRSKT